MSHSSSHWGRRWHRWARRLAALGVLWIGAGLGGGLEPGWGTLRGASPEEDQAYGVVLKQFQDGLHEVADREVTGFLKAYPDSARVPELVLIQVQSRLKLGRPEQAVALLDERAAGAGALADEFAFWRGEALLARGDFAGAADAFGRAAREFPAAARRLQSAYSEAYARFRSGDLARATAGLQEAAGPFQEAAKASPQEGYALRGRLLLAELLLLQREAAGAVAALESLGAQVPAPFEWERQYLLTRARAITGPPEVALGAATNLWTLPVAGISPALQASAALLVGQLREQSSQVDAAIEAYDRVLGLDVDPGVRRQALERSLGLSLGQGKVAETAQRLETLVRQRPQDPLLDLVRLTLGELRLREYFGLRERSGAGGPEVAGSLSNLLTQARAQLEVVVTNYPQSALWGRAQLGRGWSLWEEGTNRLAESLVAFRAATERLPRSPEQAVAQFKWADCQVRLRDYGGALSNYWQIATNSLQIPGMTNAVATQALYQIVRTGIEAEDVTSANAAVQRLLMVDPQGSLADRSELLLGQALVRGGKPEAARAIYNDFAGRFTNSALLPEVRLHVAKTYEEERNWPAAIGAYSNWLAAYRTLPDLPSNMVAQAAFDLARVSYQASPDTNALVLLTQFIGTFPAHTNAPLAQYLVGEYHFGQGDYGKAELHFQDRSLVLNTNPELAELTYRARLMAGRAAVARQSYRSARDHFDWIITNGPLHVASSPIPASAVAEAYLFRGDTFTLEPTPGETNALAQFGEAINAFSRITERFPTNEFAPLAWGRIGECHFQLATLDPKRYGAAAEAFRRVIESPADVSVRSQAEWKLGVVLERQAQVTTEADRSTLETQALDHYLRLLYGRNLRANEPADPYWVKRAGLSAAELAEALKKTDIAISIYQRLKTELPPLRLRFERKVEELQAARAKVQGASP